MFSQRVSKRSKRIPDVSAMRAMGQRFTRHRLGGRHTPRPMPAPCTHAGFGSIADTTMQVKKLKRTELSLATHQGPPSSRFKVLQWNILADGLAQHGDFIKVRHACINLQGIEGGEHQPLVSSAISNSEGERG